ncbi:HAD-IA family hydrolase [Candidatus Ruthturnera calyptogenae]|uniref:HAD-IA family hydrolase n=1 Tax=Candidatus Ruthturnera calyptogenae TaxID=386487 RepID=UPI0003034603|nr:HAD-IA family hydrolase [Candidatus Ruthturnera calyptogenae]
MVKEEQDFWHQLNKTIHLNKQKSIFFDDSFSVLSAAKQYGIDTIIAINKPSSKMSMKSIEGLLTSKLSNKRYPLRHIYKR